VLGRRERSYSHIRINVGWIWLGRAWASPTLAWGYAKFTRFETLWIINHIWLTPLMRNEYDKIYISQRTRSLGQLLVLSICCNTHSKRDGNFQKSPDFGHQFRRQFAYPCAKFKAGKRFFCVLMCCTGSAVYLAGRHLKKSQKLDFNWRFYTPKRISCA